MEMYQGSDPNNTVLKEKKQGGIGPSNQTKSKSDLIVAANVAY